MNLLVRYSGSAALPLADLLTQAYADAFGEPPWNENLTQAADFRGRLAADVRRTGFRCVVAPGQDGDIDGFASGWITEAPFRSDRAYGQVAEQLGPDGVRERLVGALEVDELAVRPRARRRGLGRQLLDALVTDAPDGRAWLLTRRDAANSVEFYRRAGWREVSPLPDTARSIVVFTSPT
jgi:ribosomal protein S18 acetylase RimI-like enzyme